MGMGTNQIISKIIPVLLRYKVKKAELLGSAARGELRSNSDVDVLVKLPEEASLLDLGGLYMDLKEALGREVDVVTYGSVNTRLAPYVFSNTIKVI